MDAKFTKAPWFHNSDDCDWSLHDEKEETILIASYLGQVEVNNAADMDLIAAAPELYEALDELANGYAGNAWDVGLQPGLKKARALVARIQGKK